MNYVNVIALSYTSTTTTSRNIQNLSSCSVLTFKRKLDAFLKTIPDDPLATNTSNCLDHIIGTMYGGSLVMA